MRHRGGLGSFDEFADVLISIKPQPMDGASPAEASARRALDFLADLEVNGGRGGGLTRSTEVGLVDAVVFDRPESSLWASIG